VAVKTAFAEMMAGQLAAFDDHLDCHAGTDRDRQSI
jgi:hypothetical protein